MARRRLQSGEGVGGAQDRATFLLAPGTRPQLTQGGRIPLSTALREAVHDRLNFFALPAPARTLLEQDMRQLGIASQRDYVCWLLMERHRQVARDLYSGRKP